MGAVLLVGLSVSAQPVGWRHRVKYTMDVDVNVSNNRFTGSQTLVYSNNSPDTLYRVFYHLYWNAFQPNSMMDTHSRELGKIVYATRHGKQEQEWEERVQDRILHLTPEEIGYQKVLSLSMDGMAQSYTVEETILDVKLTR